MKKIFSFAFINPVIDSLLLTIPLSLIANEKFDISFAISSIIFFSLVFLFNFSFLLIEAKDYLGTVTVDKFGLKKRALFVSWNDIISCEIINAYINTREKSPRRANLIFRDSNFPMYIGKMLVLTGRGEKITVPYKKSVINALNSYSNISFGSYGLNKENRIKFSGVGSLRLLLMVYILLLAFDFVMFVILWSIGLYTAIVSTICIHLYFSKMIYLRLFDAFSLVKISDKGICYQKSFTSWECIEHIEIRKIIVHFKWFEVNFGEIICINTELSDTYLGKHSAKCSYIPLNRKTKKLLEEKSIAFVEAIRKYHSNY